MPFVAGTALGTVVEGVLTLKKGELVFVEDVDSKDVTVAEVAERWLGKKVRLIINDLEVMEKLVEAGMTPGNEHQFLENLSDVEVTDIIGDDK